MHYCKSESLGGIGIGAYTRMERSLQATTDQGDYVNNVKMAGFRRLNGRGSLRMDRFPFLPELDSFINFIDEILNFAERLEPYNRQNGIGEKNILAPFFQFKTNAVVDCRCFRNGLKMSEA